MNKLNQPSFNFAVKDLVGVGLNIPNFYKRYTHLQGRSGKVRSGKSTYQYGKCSTGIDPGV